MTDVYARNSATISAWSSARFCTWLLSAIEYSGDDELYLNDLPLFKLVDEIYRRAPVAIQRNVMVPGVVLALASWRPRPKAGRIDPKSLEGISHLALAAARIGATESIPRLYALLTSAHLTRDIDTEPVASARTAVVGALCGFAVVPEARPLLDVLFHDGLFSCNAPALFLALAKGNPAHWQANLPRFLDCYDQLGRRFRLPSILNDLRADLRLNLVLDGLERSDRPTQKRFLAIEACKETLAEWADREGSRVTSDRILALRFKFEPTQRAFSPPNKSLLTMLSQGEHQSFRDVRFAVRVPGGPDHQFVSFDLLDGVTKKVVMHLSEKQDDRPQRIILESISKGCEELAANGT